MEKKCTYSIGLNCIWFCPSKIPGNEIKTHTLAALGERVNVLFY